MLGIGKQKQRYIIKSKNNKYIYVEQSMVCGKNNITNTGNKKKDKQSVYLYKFIWNGPELIKRKKLNKKEKEGDSNA